MSSPPGASPNTMHRPHRGLLGFFLDFHNKTVLLRVGDWILVTYGLLAGAAFFAGFSTALWYDGMVGADLWGRAQFYLFFSVPMILMGARALSVLLEWRELFRRPLATLLKPGYLLHGGVFGGMLAFMIHAAVTGESLLRMFDAAAFAVPLGEAVCRLGCYVYGCCWGRPTSGAIGIRYTSPHAKVVRCAPHLRGVKIHPTQVYAVIAHLGQFTAFYVLLPYVPFDGFYAAAYLISHPILRFVIERFREDDRGRLWGRLTHTNMYSLLQVGMGLAVLAAVWIGGAVVPTIDLSVRWVHVVGNSQLLPWLLGIYGVAVLAFGVHYRSVGAWVGTHTVAHAEGCEHEHD